MYVACIANKKGGIGKTATTSTLGALLGIYEQRVLLIDGNPGQANLSRYYNCQRELNTIAKIFENGNMNEQEIKGLIKKTDYKNVDIIPANETLYLDESQIPINKTASEFHILRYALRKIEKDYDFCLIDCGPNTNDFVINAICAADGVIVPIYNDGQSDDGFNNILATISQFGKDYNPKVKIDGVFFAKVNPQTNSYKQYYEKYKRALGDKLFDTYIRIEIAVSDSVSMRTPLPYYVGNSSNALLDYERILRDLKYLKGKQAAILNEKINREERREQERKKREENTKKSKWFKNKGM